MRLWIIIRIVIAVAIGVRIWLNLHKDPRYYNNLVKLLIVMLVYIIAIWFITYLIRVRLSGNVSDDDKIIAQIWEILGIIVIIIGIWTMIIWYVLSIKNEWGFKKRLENRKDERKIRNQKKKEDIAKKKEDIAKEKDRISKMSKKELMEYKKSKRPWIRFRLLIVFPALIFIAFAIGFIYLSFQ